MHRITVSGLPVEVERKAIKNLHLGVYPPHGRVRVAAPLAVSDDAVRLAVISKLGWVKRQRAKFAAQPRQSQREMVSGESHYFLGQRFRLRVVEQEGTNKVVQRGKTRLVLFVRPDTSTEDREKLLQRWYRQELKALLPDLLDKWQPLLGVNASHWGVKKMKTKWGSCNTEARRIWLNLELAKKPVQCIEYVLVHELTHLLVRRHDDEFKRVLDRHLPTWRTVRAELQRAPLGYEAWGV